VQSLYSINMQSGSATLIGSTGLRQIAGLDWDEVNNRMVALTVGGDQYAIDTATGGSTLLLDTNFGIPEGSIAMIEGQAYTTLFDNLHRWNGSNLELVGPSGLAPGSDISGLDVGNSTILGLALNGTRPDQLVAFDATTGAATILGETGTNASTVAGLATLGSIGFMSDGQSLFSLNTTTGQASLLGAHGVFGISGIAIVPAPASALLVGLAGLAAGRRRRS
jgi:hypothetical protein